MRRRLFYISVLLVLTGCVAGALTLAVVGVRSAGSTRVAGLAGAVGLFVVAYALLAVFFVSRSGDPER